MSALVKSEIEVEQEDLSTELVVTKPVHKLSWIQAWHIYRAHIESCSEAECINNVIGFIGGFCDYGNQLWDEYVTTFRDRDRMETK